MLCDSVSSFSPDLFGNIFHNLWMAYTDTRSKPMSPQDMSSCTHICPFGRTRNTLLELINAAPDEAEKPLHSTQHPKPNRNPKQKTKQRHVWSGCGVGRGAGWMDRLDGWICVRLLVCPHPAAKLVTD